MEVEGNVEETLGKVLRSYGDLKDDVEDTLKKDEYTPVETGACCPVEPPCCITGTARSSRPAIELS